MNSSEIVADCEGTASVSPGRSGWIAILREQQGEEVSQKWSASGNEAVSTSQRACLLAGIEALNAVPKDYEGLVEIRTSSQYLVQGMNDYLAKWLEKGLERRANGDLWAMLHTLCEGRDVKFVWVRQNSTDDSKAATAMAKVVALTH